MAATPLLLITAALAATEVQQVVLHVSFGDFTPEVVSAAVQQAGARREVVLVDDGSDRNDARGDRVYTGTVQGDAAQYLPIALTVEADGQRRDVYAGVVRAGLEHTIEVAFDVTTGPGGELIGRRRASASPGRTAHATEAVPLVAAGFWVVFLLTYGAIAIHLRKGGTEGAGSE